MAGRWHKGLYSFGGLVTHRPFLQSSRGGSSIVRFRFPLCLLGFGKAMKDACWIRLPIFR